MSETAEECREMCQQQTDCIAWSWYSPEHSSAKHCQTISTIDSEKEEEGIISGLRDCKSNVTA